MIHPLILFNPLGPFTLRSHLYYIENNRGWPKDLMSAQYELASRVYVTGGAVGLAVSALAWSYIGPLSGLALGGTSLLSTVYGHDIYRCGKNLENFVTDLKGELVEYINGNETEEFRKNLIDHAFKGTLILKGVFNLVPQEKASSI